MWFKNWPWSTCPPGWPCCPSWGPQTHCSIRSWWHKRSSCPTCCWLLACWHVVGVGMVLWITLNRDAVAGAHWLFMALAPLQRLRFYLVYRLASRPAGWNLHSFPNWAPTQLETNPETWSVMVHCLKPLLSAAHCPVPSPAAPQLLMVSPLHCLCLQRWTWNKLH